MSITCNDRDRIFEDGTPAEWGALEAHANACPACAEELRAWKSLSLAAQELRDYAQSPALWPRIANALAEEAEGKELVSTRWSWLKFWRGISPVWQTAVAGAFAILVAVAGAWFYVHAPKPGATADNQLLRSKALTEVERTQAAYVQAIGKLAAEAKPQMENPATPLLASYREKLLVLDSAIDDLRAQAGENSSNAHLRYELLAMYQEKQRTLEEILEEKQ
jgi:hypothetical protein